MNKQNQNIIHRLVKVAAAKIDGLLPPEPSHPAGRIPVAHIYDVIKRVMGVPARECDDNRFDDIVSIIDFCASYPEEPHCATKLKPLIKPQEIRTPRTLTAFFE